MAFLVLIGFQVEKKIPGKKQEFKEGGYVAVNLVYNYLYYYYSLKQDLPNIVQTRHIDNQMFISILILLYRKLSIYRYL